MADVKRIDIAEFRALGFLQEVNRRFFHPHGLALEISVEPCSCDGGHIEDGPSGATYSIVCPQCNGTEKVERLGGIWDYREDPEGIIFSDDMIDPEKIAVVVAEMEKHRAHREALFGTGIIQPPGARP